MFGVLPCWRGKGWGRIILIESLIGWAERGATRVELTVDEENRPAVRLYRSLDFKDKETGIWYELKLH